MLVLDSNVRKGRRRNALGYSVSGEVDPADHREASGLSAMAPAHAGPCRATSDEHGPE